MSSETLVIHRRRGPVAGGVRKVESTEEVVP